MNVVSVGYEVKSPDNIPFYAVGINECKKENIFVFFYAGTFLLSY
jgi:hypothetical protein